ncbi:MAG: outer membrane beta-barrel protein [Acidobacteriia bacterium]|nr:outer membrane beta-barrel protein [Terriglobia bacterium]
MRHRRAVSGLAAALALGYLPAHAEGPLEPPDLARYLQWGPVRARPGVVLTNLGRDGNITYNPHQPVSDYTATVSPRVEGVVLFGHRGFMTFTEQLDWTIYKSNRDQDYLNQLGSARLTIPLKRLGFYVDAALNDVKDRPADQRDTRTDIREHRLGAGLLIRAGWRTDAEIGVVGSSFGYRDPNYANLGDPACPTVGCLLDRTERGARALGRYLVFGRTRLTLEVSEKSVTFSNSENGSDGKQSRVLPGIEFGLGGRLTGTARLGWASLEPERAGLPRFSGTVGEARLGYRIGAGTTFEVGGKRDVGFSIYLKNGYYLDTSGSARVIQYLTHAFGVEAGTVRERITFPDPSSRVDRVVQYDAGVRVRLSENALGRKVEYSFKVTRWVLTTTVPGQNQSRTAAGFGAVIGY